MYEGNIKAKIRKQTNERPTQRSVRETKDN